MYKGRGADRVPIEKEVGDKAYATYRIREELFAETMREESEDRLNRLYFTLMEEQKA